MATTQTAPIAAGTRIGHVHLKVSDLDRAVAFYCGVLGFDLIQKYGNQAAFISAAIITISGSIPGKVPAVHRRRPAPPACFTSPSSIRPAPISPMR